MSHRKDELHNLRSLNPADRQKNLQEVSKKIILGKSQQKDKNIHILKNLRHTRSRILTIIYENQTNAN